MFFRRKRAEGDDDAQLGKLDEIVGDQNPLTEGIRRALERDDLTPEDRRELEAALKRIQDQKPPD